MLDFYNQKYPKARKEHKCELCNNVIRKGEKYSCESGKYDGDMFTRRLCLTCRRILEAYCLESGCDEFDWWEITDWLHDKYCNNSCDNYDDGNCDEIEVQCPIIREHLQSTEPDITAQEP